MRKGVRRVVLPTDAALYTLNEERAAVQRGNRKWAVGLIYSGKRAGSTEDRRTGNLIVQIQNTEVMNHAFQTDEGADVMSRIAEMSSSVRLFTSSCNPQRATGSSHLSSCTSALTVHRQRPRSLYASQDRRRVRRASSKAAHKCKQGVFRSGMWSRSLLPLRLTFSPVSRSPMANASELHTLTFQRACVKKNSRRSRNASR